MRLLTYLIFCATALLQAETDYLQLTNKSGVTIMALPLKAEGSTLTIKRNDGQVFDLDMTTLSQETRELIGNYFSRKTDEPTPPQQDAKKRNARIPEGEIMLSRNLAKIESATYYDPIDDYLKVHERDEMDIESVTIERHRLGMAFQINFVDAPGSLTDKLYRIWLNINIDGDESTGMTESHHEGSDMAIAIFGQGEGREWEFYTVAKSDIGRKHEFAIEDIEVDDHSIRFVVEGKPLKRSQAFGVSLTSLAEAGKVLDHFPNSGMMPFSFDQETYEEAKAAALAQTGK